jgi:hypothetical protein
MTETGKQLSTYVTQFPTMHFFSFSSAESTQNGRTNLEFSVDIGDWKNSSPF